MSKSDVLFIKALLCAILAGTSEGWFLIAMSLATVVYVIFFIISAIHELRSL